MTEMKRVTISLPDEMDRKVLELKKQERFVRCSYSEVVRILMMAGYEKEFGKECNEKPDKDAS